MTENEFILEDRIAKIKAINEQYDLENNAYLSFSGGKDSTILHYLLDMAIPNNKIPRVFLNTGIEYQDIVKFVKEMALKDDRFVLVAPSKNIKKVLDEYGYPFKSKEHSRYVSVYQNIGVNSKTVDRYLHPSEKRKSYGCPKILLYQFNPEFKLNISHLCCFKLKKDPAHNWEKENNKSIVLTGMRKAEGGTRINLNCIVTNKSNELKKFHPLLVITNEWEEQFIQSNNIKLCRLYYPPYNFTRTGCKGCPFALDLQKQLDIMEELLPNEKAQCELIWKPVYDEYRRLGYRLKKKE